MTDTELDTLLDSLKKAIAKKNKRSKNSRKFYLLSGAVEAIKIKLQNYLKTKMNVEKEAEELDRKVQEVGTKVGFSEKVTKHTSEGIIQYLKVGSTDDVATRILADLTSEGLTPQILNKRIEELEANKNG